MAIANTGVSRPVEFSISLQNRGVLAQPNTLLLVAERAETLGYNAIWVTDHIVIPFPMASRYPYSPSGRFIVDATVDYLEPVTSLAFLAGRTRRIRVGTSVLVVGLRHPLLTAKALATLDVLSGGRLIVGVGTGWLAEEFAALGVPFHGRVERSEEYLRIFREVWTNPRPQFKGKFVSFANIGFEPKPLQKPHPPIWIGGHGRRVLQLVAELGDGWTPMGLRPPGVFEPDTFAVEVAKLYDLVAARGRDPGAIVVAIKVPVRFTGGANSLARQLLTGTPEQIAEDLMRYRSVGVQHFVLDFATDDSLEMLATLDRFAHEVRPVVH